MDFTKRAGFALASIVVIVGLFVVLVLGLAWTNNLNATVAPLVITPIISLIVSVVPSLIALARIEDVKYELENGLITKKVKEALRRHFAQLDDSVGEPTTGMSRKDLENDG